MKQLLLISILGIVLGVSILGLYASASGENQGKDLVLIQLLKDLKDKSSVASILRCHKV